MFAIFVFITYLAIGYVTKSGAVKSADFKNKFLNFSCWDFAGQEVYYAIHSVFLTSRAIYILVFNLLYPIEDSEIEFWLKSILSRTEGAVVILVGTHADEKQCTKE